MWVRQREKVFLAEGPACELAHRWREVWTSGVMDSGEERAGE